LGGLVNNGWYLAVADDEVDAFQQAGAELIEAFCVAGGE